METNANFRWIGCSALAAMLMLAGCFENKGKPEDVPTVIGVNSLVATNRAGIVRVILRGDRAALPDGAFSGLNAVEMLDLSERGTKEVPAAALAVKGIKEFYFCRNEMEKVPEFTNWEPTLTYLNLDDNKIKELPAAIGKCTELKWLRLNRNALKALPSEISGLQKLKRIYLKQNALDKVPEVLSKLTNIEDIALDGNPIGEVPGWMVELPNIRSVSLANTRVSKLPENLIGWRKLEFLSLGGCPINKSEMDRIREQLPKVAVVF